MNNRIEQNKDFPSFWAALLILALLIGVEFIIPIIAHDFGFTYEAGDPKASGLIVVLSNGIVISLLMGYKKVGYPELFNTSSNSFKSIFIIFTLPLFLTVGAAVFWVSDLTNLIILFYPMGKEEYLIYFRLLEGGVISIITVCLIAPFVEEILFRGIFLRGFLFNYSPKNSILLSAFLFSIFHLNIYQIPVAFILGCFFAWLHYRTDSLWPSIIGHILYNSCVMVFWSMEDVSEKAGAELMVHFNSFVCLLQRLLRH